VSNITHLGCDTMYFKQQLTNMQMFPITINGLWIQSVLLVVPVNLALNLRVVDPGERNLVFSTDICESLFFLL